MKNHSLVLTMVSLSVGLLLTGGRNAVAGPLPAGSPNPLTHNAAPGWSRPAAPAAPAPARDVNADMRALWSLVNPQVPSADPVIAAHQRKLAPIIEEYRRDWLDKAMPLLSKIVPAHLPGTVVYPFGGVDLMTALATFPAATDITTISLEPAGAAAHMFNGSSKDLAKRLELFRKYFAFLLHAAFNRSDNLTTLTDENVPGPVLFALLGIYMHGFEPVSLRYLRLDLAGGIQYVSDQDVQRELSNGNSRAFENAEITFRRGDGGPVIVHRHFYVDLSDGWLTKYSGLLKYLDQKGRFVAMTKAASYLLWDDGFSVIRKYLLDHMAWMISDATGIPPSIAQEAGFEQITYGHFTAAILKVNKDVQQEFRDLWKKQPVRPLPFRYGYPDHGTGSNQLMVTRPIQK